MSKSKNEPLYIRLKDKIRSQVLSGELPPATRLPSHVEMCRTYGVSQITVRRAIQDLTVEGLLTTRPGSGTYVDSQPRHRHSRQQKQICVVMENILGGYPLLPGYPLVHTMYATMRQRCEAAGSTLQFVEAPAVDVSDGRIPLQLPNQCAAAVLTSPVSVPVISEFQRRRIPYALVNNDLSDGFSYCVLIGYAWGVLKAALHLYEIGCKRLMLVTAEELRQSAGQMRMGMEMAYSAASMHRDVPRPCIVAGSYEPDRAHRLAQTWIDGNELPDGVIYASDTMARAALFALTRAGVDVPGRVAIVGFGNMVKPSETPMEITTVDPDDAAVGNAVMDVLTELIAGRKPTVHRQVIEPKLIVRASSRRE